MGDLGKLIVAKGFKKLPKVQKIAQSGHTATYVRAPPANVCRYQHTLDITFHTIFVVKQ